MATIQRLEASSVNLVFTDYKNTVMSVDGACCSSSIFYDIVFPHECIGAEITGCSENVKGQSENEASEIVRARFPDWLSDTPDSLSVWDVAFHTAKGDILVRHINESNGYYDGCLSFYDQ